MERIQPRDRRQLASQSMSKMATALTEVWRKGECKLVKQTLDGAADPIMREKWKQEVLHELLPTERDYFNRFVG